MVHQKPDRESEKTVDKSMYGLDNGCIFSDEGMLRQRSYERETLGMNRIERDCGVALHRDEKI
jgi:hypothetical protein